MLSFLGNYITIPWSISDDNSRGITQSINIYVRVMCVKYNLLQTTEYNVLAIVDYTSKF